jgi:hypothetical protein
MILDRSVRRRALVCETLLLLMLYGVEALTLTRFGVELNPDASTIDNRVVFASRDGDEEGADGENGALAGAAVRADEGGSADADAGTTAAVVVPSATTPQRHRKGSVVAPRIKKVLKSMKKAFSRTKTDHLSRLTRHLHKEDEGDHWCAPLIRWRGYLVTPFRHSPSPQPRSCSPIRDPSWVQPTVAALDPWWLFFRLQATRA